MWWERREFYKQIRNFRDRDGAKLPMDDLATIERHQAMREEYVGKYGARTILRRYAEFDMFYGEIRRNAERKEKYRLNDERIAREAKERADRAVAREKRISDQNEKDEKAKAESAIKQAHDDIKKYEWNVDYYEQQIRLKKEQISGTEERIAKLSDEFLESIKGTSTYSPLRRDRKRKEAALPGYKKDLALYEGKLDENKDLMVERIKYLKGKGIEVEVREKPPVVESKAPVKRKAVIAQMFTKQAVASKSSETDSQWQPEWDRPAQSEFRELKNIPDNWKVSKLVLIWRDKNTQEIRIFARSKKSIKMALDALFGVDNGIEIDFTSGSRRFNSKISREQYDKASGNG